MLTVYSDRHRLQNGRLELVFDHLDRPFERPERADAIAEAIAAAKLGDVVAPGDFGVAPILRTHDRRMVDFIEHGWSMWRAAHGDSDALPPASCFRGMRHQEPESIEGKLSYYAADTGTPLTAGTWDAARESVNVALTGLQLLEQRALRHVFSLCRPPGHHAMRDYYGGYCFFNNAAIAAQAALDRGANRVAIVDVDYHHGNGIQSIFYARNDVLYVSLHADPAMEYPYFSGYADEVGEAGGEGYTLNFPMPRGTDWSRYGDALATGLERVKSYAPDMLVVSLGVDTWQGDPISTFRLTRDDFCRIGESIAALGLRTLIVMEGGYDVAAIGANVCSVLSGFEQ